jgi:chromosome segregation ATPase
MSKLGGFFMRKPALVNTLPEPTPTDAVAQINNPLEVDEELFSSLGAQMGGDNEALRNLLLDANAKIAELDTIKAAVGKLADPVSKTLRELEAEKAEKISLQTVLNNTRTAYGKLRNEVAELEKKTATAESEARSLRQDLTTTLSQLHSAEATKAEIAIDIAARRAQIIDLEARLAQEAGDNTALRDENRRLDERLSVTEKRIMALESDLNGARARLLMAEDEKNAQQTLLDRASVETARLARKLSETESSLGAVQGRLRQVEANYSELSNERSRLTVALDDVNERHDRELTTQRMRYDALLARSQATEKLLVEAREHLLAKANEIRDYDRRIVEVANERDTLHSRVTALDADRVQRDSEIKELEQVRATLMDRAGSLARAYTSKEAALGRAEEAITALNMRIGVLETAIATHRQNAEQQIEELTASLKREKMERSVLEGALETGRKDCARLMREVMVLQRARDMGVEHQPLAANAA